MSANAGAPVGALAPGPAFLLANALSLPHLLPKHQRSRGFFVRRSSEWEKCPEALPFEAIEDCNPGGRKKSLPVTSLYAPEGLKRPGGAQVRARRATQLGCGSGSVR